MKLSSKGLEFIKRHEGFRPTAYKCPGKVWTIGYGHTKEVREGDTISISEATDLLRDDVEYAEDAVNAFVAVPLNQNQFDALTSFIFNVGVSAFRESTLRRKLNDSDYGGAAAQFPRWNKAAGRVLPGLIARREAEREMFES